MLMTANRKPPNAGKGRPKGVPNKLTTELKDMILGALEDAGGREYLVEQATKNPPAFMALLGRTMPKDVKHEIAGNLTVLLNGKGVQPNP